MAIEKYRLQLLERFNRAVNELLTQKIAQDQTEIAVKIHTTPQIISDIKRLRRFPTIAQIAAIAKEYPTLNTNYIIRGEGEVIGKSGNLSAREMQVLVERNKHLEERLRAINKELEAVKISEQKWQRMYETFQNLVDRVLPGQTTP